MRRPLPHPALMAAPRPFVALLLAGCGSEPAGPATCPDLSDTTFTIRARCSESPADGGDDTCVDDDIEDAFTFSLSTGTSFSITDDAGRIFGGTLDGTTLTWTRTVTTASSGAYEEAGTFTFVAECQSLWGASTYTYGDDAADGACSYQGRVDGYPDAPDAVGACE
jgi:hypothetical protein